ncbi:28 kDa heat- and acid-stable phosphoprotein-like [Drosophila innubila]|uniref:28 kDa heat- and acid-stable phosphoprotein-like n=1 Tax=Drosophila innubila TaxID=198719 RepID=UPI00148CB16D|nr:28 kDa heat- and acid-stable phosphoprotein-like [Drosophila innubila]
MPRGKFLNHKGQSRQFTPVEELQREQDLEWNLNRNFHWQYGNGNGNGNGSGSSNDNINIETVANSRVKKMGNAVEGLIEISNPNRTILKSSESSTGSLSGDRYNKDKQRFNQNNQKRANEMKADIERLALVRKKREAAAELRLAAKKENNLAIVTPIVTPIKSKSDMSLKKKGQKHKSNGSGSNNSFLNTDFDNIHEKDNDIRKLIKERNGNKRNGMHNA